MWRLLCEKESFWGSLLLRKYGILNLDTLLGGGYPIKGSRWWCDILKSCELLENGLGWFQKNISRVIGLCLVKLWCYFEIFKWQVHNGLL